MVLETGIIGGFCFLTFLFAYVSFNLKESETTFGQVASLVFFNMALLFSNFVLYTMLLIVQQNAGVAYLSSPIMNVALIITMWVTVIAFFAYFLLTLLNGIQEMFTLAKDKFKP